MVKVMNIRVKKCTLEIRKKQHLIKHIVLINYLEAGINEEVAKRAVRGLFGFLCIAQPFPYKEIPGLTSENS